MLSQGSWTLSKTGTGRYAVDRDGVVMSGWDLRSEDGRQRSRSERAFWGLALDICLDEYSHETYVDSDSILQAIAGAGR